MTPRKWILAWAEQMLATRNAAAMEELVALSAAQLKGNS
jgi:hypothetical protein